MNKIVISFFVFILFIVCGISAKASLGPAYPQLTVGYLFDKCQDDRKKDGIAAKMDASYCYGFFYGINYALTPYHDKLMCVPENLNHLEEAKIFIKWAKDNPQLWHIDQMNGVIYALSSTYPCRR